MKQFHFFFFILLFSFITYSQQGISGTLIDGDFNEPLPFANILVKETGDGITSDFDGIYAFELSAGTIDQALRFHDLRHTTGSWLAQAGVVTSEIQQILCHKSIATTQRYIHHSTSGKAKTLQRVFSGLA